MSVNGVTTSDSTAAYAAYSTSARTGEVKAEEAKTQNAAEETGVVYEKSDAAQTASKATYKPNTALVQQLKADQDAQKQNLVNIVQKMMGKQAETANTANGNIWKFLANGNFTVDAATKAQAQKDIAEDGYWGVNQTSSRILDFATALTGGDPDKIEDMRAAFEKGFKQATKTWGKELPDISQKTYDAVMKGFDDMAEKAGRTTGNVELS